MTERLANWLDDRFAWRAVWEAIFLRKVPHVNWLYTLGSATLSNGRASLSVPVLAAGAHQDDEAPERAATADGGVDRRAQGGHDHGAYPTANYR